MLLLFSHRVLLLRILSTRSLHNITGKNFITYDDLTIVMFRENQIHKFSFIFHELTGKDYSKSMIYEQ